jgi:hypothetical protein
MAHMASTMASNPIKARAFATASIAAALFFSQSACAADATVVKAPLDTEYTLRSDLLKKYLAREGSAAVLETYGGLGVSVLAAGGIAAVIVNKVGTYEPSQPFFWSEIASIGGMGLLGASTYLVPDEARMPILTAMGAGLLPAAYALYFYQQYAMTPTQKFSAGAIVGTGLAAASLILIDLAFGPRVSHKRLSAHLDRLKSGATPEEIRTIERDFAKTERPVPSWVLPGILAVGALTAASPAVFAKTVEDKQYALLMGSLLFTPGVVGLAFSLFANRQGYEGYRSALEKLQLAPVGPRGTAGVTLSVSF